MPDTHVRTVPEDAEQALQSKCTGTFAARFAIQCTAFHLSAVTPLLSTRSCSLRYPETLTFNPHNRPFPAV